MNGYCQVCLIGQLIVRDRQVSEAVFVYCCILLIALRCNEDRDTWKWVIEHGYAVGEYSVKEIAHSYSSCSFRHKRMCLHAVL